MPSLRSAAWALLSLVLVLPACNGDGTGPAVPTTLQAAAGDNQTGTVGQPLAQPVQVRVLDASGRPVSGLAVSFVVTGGGGSVAVPTSTTDATGVASNQWTLGSSATAAQTLEARVSTAGGPVLTFTFTATPRAAAAAALQDVTGLHAGVPGAAMADSLAVRAVDSFGNPVPGATVSWTVNQGGGAVSPTSSVTGANGIARTRLTLGAATDVPHVVLATTSGTGVEVAVLPVASIDAIAVNPTTGSGGSAVNIGVTVNWAHGGLVGVPVEWTVLSGGGSVTPATSVSGTTGPSYYGLATTAWTLGAGGGVQTLRARFGTVEEIISINVVAQGTRTLLGEVPGRVVDALGSRILWVDSASGNAVLKIRTAGGGDQVVPGVSGGGPLFGGHLHGDGALAWDGTTLYDHRGGASTSLGSYANSRVAVEEGWAAWQNATSVLRRDLSTGTNTTVADSVAGALDVGPDGDVVYQMASNRAWLYTGGGQTRLDFDAPSARLYTDGTSVVYVEIGVVTSSARLWLDAAGADETLTSHSSKSGGLIWFDLHGGWTAFSNPLTAAVRRSPGGSRETLTTESIGMQVEAVSPGGDVVYLDRGRGEYFLVTAGGARAALGPGNDQFNVLWRGNRFILLAGTRAYVLSA